MAAGALLVVLVGCSESDPGLADDDTVGDAPLIEVEAQLSEIVPTVFSVRWTVDAEEAESGWVEYGADETYGNIWPGTADGAADFKAALAGFKPSTTVHFRAVAVVDGVEVHGGDESLATGALPVDLPVPSVATHDPPAATGGYLVTSVNTDEPSVVILDADGDVVWWYTPDDSWNLLFISRASLGLDRGSVLYLSTPDVVQEGDHQNQWIVEVSIDGVVRHALQVEDAHHDFLELSDGSLAVLEADFQMVGDLQVKGDRLVEHSPDGSKREVFSAWDHLTYAPDDEGEHPADEWTHVNAVDLDEEAGVYYLSAHHLDSILKIDRDTGELLWQAGGDDSNFALSGGSTDLFQWQHQFELVDGGILVFDNGTSGDMNSRVVQYDLDEDAQMAEQVWEFEPDPTLWIYCLGDVSRLPNGNTLITWGTSGRIEEVTPEGETVLQIDLPLGAGFGYTSWSASLAPAS